MAYRTENPATGVVEQEFTSLTDADVARAVERADAAFTSWRKTPAEQRAAALAAVADAFQERGDELARVISTEMGKPFAQAQGEVALSSSIYRWYADHGPALLQEETLDVGDSAKSVVVTDPVGVLMGVMPWNFPQYQVARFAAPNLMLGNTILLKHASICARTAELIEEILHAAGIPEDAYINLFVSTDQITDVVADPRVRGVSLTGSEGAGKAVATTAAQNLKKSVLELGGSDPLVVLDDVDVSKTAKTVATARMSNAGQACNSPKRIFVPAGMFDEFVKVVVETVEAMTVGNPLEDGTDVGPLSSVQGRDDAVAQVERAVEQGATLHTGGKALDKDGAWMSPAVLTGVTREMDAFKEEIFGPVAVVYSYDSVDEAVELANDSSFGLSGSVWSSDVAKAEEIARQLEVGMTYVNEHGTTKAGLPFGGVRRSGYGRELGRWGFGEFANTKLVRVAG
ncbi:MULTISPECIES: NAD-dependent succinate-semialdehyde dehydrogenase [Kocuria]|uniref:Succinate-semialdehyde dehydrogenase [NADP(+)] 1 n=2 Tax=Kocuria TaxID=57493 RepID=A0A7D7Q2H6_KOCVA|nr:MULTISPECIES: NAD-dependent succinate-semialdehyde dehydrogenase [Kocuria]MBS6029929.1 NAD-dependent succinate-semialdehyde dehydrogenase [Kocuria rhizophila]QMS56181.1 Succinate-semialdehyde dehydrogenase [NADP(+)] 1 [Kocuria varians]RUP84132.1 NAD-dependent succinate-semialdehyde dehydrogenase [Kocuria sp. HSID17590]RUQ08782.1 NAD-dependent succinate-semialdehyde dehydrogenase [Kocuria sp. HSID17582]